MIRRKLTLADSWQTFGMSQAGFSNRRVAVQMEIHHSLIDCLVLCFYVTGMVDECPQNYK